MDLRQGKKALLLLGLLAAAGVLAFHVEPGNTGKTYTAEEILDNPEEFEDKEVQVKGNLSRGPLACTEMECIENECCNTCSAELLIDRKLKAAGSEIGCSGTNCGLNCTPEPGNAYVFTGTFQSETKTFEIEGYRKMDLES